MKVQNGTWTEQIDIVKKDLNISIQMTYPIGLTGLTPYTFTLQEQSTHPPYTYAEPQPSKKTNSLSTTTYPIGTSVILYSTNILADPQLWDGNFTVTSLFRTNKFLTGNVNNIACSLQHIATFIKQRSIHKKDVNSFLQLQEIGLAAWEFISAIYKAG